MESLTNIVVSEGEIGNIARVLGRLILDTGASHVLLLDKSGQLISAQGQAGQRDLVALGALLAGAFASSRHVAEILGERDFRSILQQGVQESIYTSLVGEQWLLVVVFEKQAHIGLVKVLARKALKNLSVPSTEYVSAARQPKNRSSMCSSAVRSRTRLTGSSRTEQSLRTALPRATLLPGYCS